MRITMVGTGYVGLVSGACLAETGHEVTCIDLDQKKIEKLKQGQSTIYEPGLEQLIRQNIANERLFFSTVLADHVNSCDALIVAVGTPEKADGSADLSQVESVIKELAANVDKDLLVLIKSTVPIGTGDLVEKQIEEGLTRRGKKLNIVVASNPEFLKEGSAISDFMQPDRIVIGVAGKEDRTPFINLYSSFVRKDPHVLYFAERRASEMIKYVANSMLATRISFMNEMAQLCERIQVNIEEVKLGIACDSRIGSEFLSAGPGYGGSCFPKDVSALLEFSKAMDLDLKVLGAVQDVNALQQRHALGKITKHFGSVRGKTIAIWGLSFKPGTDDVRESPAYTIVKGLLQEGAKVQAHDPVASVNFALSLGDEQGISYVNNEYEACNGADALVLITDWSQYRFPNWQKVCQKVKQKVVFDFRNVYDPAMLSSMGVFYSSIGRPDHPPSTLRG